MKGIWTYEHLLPFIGRAGKITLGEGGTPLVRSRRIGPMMGLENLYFKLETVNPTGSYKDRFAAAALTDILENRGAVCLATSSGNTGSALAAYAAAAAVQCFIVTVEGAPSGKIEQMRAYGAHVLEVKGFGRDPDISSDVMGILNTLARENHSIVQTSAYACHPLAMSGVQTIAYEIAAALPTAGKQVFVPAGGGGLTLALIKGFQIWEAREGSGEITPVHCVQPEGNNTIAGSLRNGSREATPISSSTTAISGLQVPNVLDGDQVVSLSRGRGGQGYVVTDQSVYDAQRLLAVTEGIFSEPAGAVSLAGLQQAVQRKEVQSADVVVCVVTGTGFKDPVSASRLSVRTAFERVAVPGDVLKRIQHKMENNNQKESTHEK